jgi:hypothetical protein|tara:strand:+ start:1089 stop:1685 length:597 start_codon:yes stop_codon:yes gene_type:complete
MDTLNQTDKSVSEAITDCLKEVQKRKQLDDEVLCLERLKKDKEYNEKISNTIFGTGLKPSVVGKINSENPQMDYSFVSFDKVEKKEPIEYLDKNKVDYDINVTDGSGNKKIIPQSFLMIKEGEIEKGKNWYLNHDPKLPEGIAEMMARYNWGDLKYMTKKSAKRDRKKYAKKGKDLGVECGLSVKTTDKNNPFIIDFN